MTTLIITPAGTFAPVLVEGYEASRSGGTLVHEIIGRADPDVTLRPAGMRTGKLTLLFADEAAAHAADGALSAGIVVTLVDDARSIGMSFVIPNGQQITLTLDDTTRNHWHLSVPFQEVAP